MQGARDARALERLPGGVFRPRRHQARHFGFRDGDLLSPECGKPNIGDSVISGVGHNQIPVLVSASLISEAGGVQ